jgi:hypothetical protein
LEYIAEIVEKSAQPDVKVSAETEETKPAEPVEKEGEEAQENE